MATTITSNKKNSLFAIHVAGANSGNVVVSGNSITTNVNSTSACIAIDDEVLTGAYITQIFYGTGVNTSINILRGSNIVAVVSGTGHLNFNAHSLALNVGSSANLAVNIVGDANSFVMIELKKIGGGSSEYFQS